MATDHRNLDIEHIEKVFITKHPRLRGELVEARHRLRTDDGSSPLARGTQLARIPRIKHIRFIPTCAGNSIINKSPVSEKSVHPRLRGELHCRRFAHLAIAGSSPLARGTHLAEPRKLFDVRFIPACAGNSFLHRLERSPATVHPRSRGELARADSGKKYPVGSSPLARGTLQSASLPIVRRRFIPACAGNSQAKRGSAVPGSVHPRLRGELAYR